MNGVHLAIIVTAALFVFVTREDLAAVFGRYKVMDNHGVRVPCLTLRGAIRAMSGCSNEAACIMDRLTGRVIARRWVR